MKSKLLLSLGLIATLGIFQTKAMEHSSDYEIAKSAFSKLTDSEIQAILKLSPSDLKSMSKQTDLKLIKDLRQCFRIPYDVVVAKDVTTVYLLCSMNPGVATGLHMDHFYSPPVSDLFEDSQMLLLQCLEAGVFENLLDLELYCHDNKMMNSILSCLEKGKFPHLKKLAIGITGYTPDPKSPLDWSGDFAKRQLSAMLASDLRGLEKLTMMYDLDIALDFALEICKAKDKFPKLRSIQIYRDVSKETCKDIEQVLENTGVLIYGYSHNNEVEKIQQELRAKWEKMHANDAE